MAKSSSDSSMTFFIIVAIALTMAYMNYKKKRSAMALHSAASLTIPVPDEVYKPCNECMAEKSCQQ